MPLEVLVKETWIPLWASPEEKQKLFVERQLARAVRRNKQREGSARRERVREGKPQTEVVYEQPDLQSPHPAVPKTEFASEAKWLAMEQKLAALSLERDSTPPVPPNISSAPVSSAPSAPYTAGGDPGVFLDLPELSKKPGESEVEKSMSYILKIFNAAADVTNRRREEDRIKQKMPSLTPDEQFRLPVLDAFSWCALGLKVKIALRDYVDKKKAKKKKTKQQMADEEEARQEEQEARAIAYRALDQTYKGMKPANISQRWIR
jgi:hypothetical protein